eukprot:TRINITY_DN4566_c0_g1_i8.p1 TRINITY_DN4566_c0_g1~~TRINITY_DN4566_c0_g1_i8.p1  ORF type:complete len:253 (+),score=39.81 TRINITY_DN4566_c0_g1_i8:91-849(+)
MDDGVREPARKMQRRQPTHFDDVVDDAVLARVLGGVCCERDLLRAAQVCRRWRRVAECLWPPSNTRWAKWKVGQSDREIAFRVAHNGELCWECGCASWTREFVSAQSVLRMCSVCARFVLASQAELTEEFCLPRGALDDLPFFGRGKQRSLLRADAFQCAVNKHGSEDALRRRLQKRNLSKPCRLGSIHFLDSCVWLRPPVLPALLHSRLVLSAVQILFPLERGAKPHTLVLLADPTVSPTFIDRYKSLGCW